MPRRYSVKNYVASLHTFSDTSNAISRSLANPDPLDLEPPVLAPKTYLPRAFITYIGAHSCSCQQCDPEYQQDLLDTARNRAAEQYAKDLEDEVITNMRGDVIQQHWDEINAEAGTSARDMMREQILREELDRYKEGLRKEYQEELRATMRKEIEEEVRREFNAKVASLQLL
ncbi:hypothetical protein HO173_003235 [Letharia columbiana]|uniref:Uncharacterized protein n=1 Tax=Letharia columbiana TaxID=112416 RepID=A0A8H6G1D0_9LECA|nr:uncharacterized protein HO173_003235 [Letharia columbiana]KAF6238729.1 hypothetical protein HO173_003235 [Letharia columbiana]